MVKGKCSRCPNGQFYNRATATCLVAFYSKSGSDNSLSVCQPNEIEVNGKCDCNGNSVRANGNCVACPQSAYKSQNQCLNCTNYCSKCQSA